MKVLCSHEMFTTVWVCKEKRIQLYAGVDIWLDKDLADKYSSTFKQLDPQPESAQTITISISEARQLPLPVEDLDELQAKAELENKEIVHAQALIENVEFDGKAVKTEHDDNDKAPDPDDVKDDLIEAIDGFTSKKKLDEYAADLGVELDRRKSLKNMRLALKKEWNLI